MIRAYIEHRLDQRPGVQKLYYLGPMFRRERPQKGRYRQFYQIGAEAIGSESANVDAEVIEMVVEILHTVRDPLDTCVSCYSKLFGAGTHRSTK